MYDKYIPSIKIENVINRRKLKAQGCSCGCLGVYNEQNPIEQDINKVNHNKKELD